MLKILIGIILFVIGITSITSDFEFMWTGAIIVGPVIVIQGYKSILNARKSKEIQLFFSSNALELKNRISNGESIDNVAENLFTNREIPVSLTYDFYGNLLINELNSVDESVRNDVLQLLKTQRRDSDINISTNIKYFSTDSTIIRYDDSAQLYIENKVESGLFLLSKSHILFFSKHESVWKNVLEKISDKVYETPAFFIPLFFDLLFAVKSEIQTPLNKAKLNKLKTYFDKGKCVHVIISELESIDIVKKGSGLLSHSCILLSAKNGKEMCLGTSETDAKEWVNNICKQIKITALAEGKNLF